MTSSLTDRYVRATVAGLDDGQRADVERELRTTIEDMVEARADAGEPTAEAERAVLTELGDPMRLAAGYSGRPLHLIGPGVYPHWLRLTRLLLVIIVPLAVLGHVVARLLTDAVATDGIGTVAADTVGLALTVALHVVFWTTLVFAVIERTTASGELGSWDPDELPEDADRRVGIAETAGSLVLLALVALALVWQQTSPPVRLADTGVPVLDPALWNGWLPLLLVVLLADAVLAVVVFRVGYWTRRLDVVGAALDLAFAVPVLFLLSTDRLFNPAFVEELVQGGWEDAQRDLTVSTTIGILVILVWSLVERIRRDRAGAR
jgi:hypothetical protein